MDWLWRKSKAHPVFDRAERVERNLDPLFVVPADVPRLHVQQELVNLWSTEKRHERWQFAQAAIHGRVQDRGDQAIRFGGDHGAVRKLGLPPSTVSNWSLERRPYAVRQTEHPEPSPERSQLRAGGLDLSEFIRRKHHKSMHMVIDQHGQFAARLHGRVDPFGDLGAIACAKPKRDAIFGEVIVVRRALGMCGGRHRCRGCIGAHLFLDELGKQAGLVELTMPYGSTILPSQPHKDSALAVSTSPCGRRVQTTST